MRRAEITLFHSPILTTQLFLQYVYDGWTRYQRRIRRHWAFLPVICAALFLATLRAFPKGSHEQFIMTLEEELLFIIWWLGLGIASSVGLGTGLHTGLFFLFPHIYNVVQAASLCNSLDFNSRQIGYSFFARNSPPFHCNSIGTEPVSFLATLSKVWWPCFIWGTGTAIGEIPPYFLAYQAALAHEQNSEEEEDPTSSFFGTTGAALTGWMKDFVTKGGFWGLLLMASWPNAAFDLCGILCGHLLMPFSHFFLATWIGKAMIKVTAQAAVFVAIFDPTTLTLIVKWVDALFPPGYDPCQWVAGKECQVWLNDYLQAQVKKMTSAGPIEPEPQGWMSFLFAWAITLYLIVFFKSAIEQMAQSQCKELAMTETPKED